MISFEKAKQIALDKIGLDCGLMEDETLEKPYGWYFWFQSQAFLKSGETQDLLVGSGGFIVEREDGRVFEFGSAFSLERNLAAYEAGFKFESYDLIITGVSNVDETVNLLFKLDMTYVIPELENGVVWKIPKHFTRSELKAKLEVLPCVFTNQKFYFRVEVFWKIDEVRCCKYQLSEHRAD